LRENGPEAKTAQEAIISPKEDGQQEAGLDRAEAGGNPGTADGLSKSERIPLTYAKGYTLERYENGAVLITILGKDRYYVVPEGQEAPGKEELAAVGENVVVIQQPAENIYLAASAVMDIFRKLDAVSSIRLSGTAADGWYIEEAKEAMEDGRILYAGKYSTPDYELILEEGCRLAIENAMIDHTPEVREKLQSFDIPVLTDYASYEEHPLGRVEWVKLYGILLGKEAEAEEIFERQLKTLEAVEEDSGAGRKEERPRVAFFYITNNGAANVRKSTDYVPKMIELAGGQYIYDDLGDPESHSSSMTMQIEEFYATAWDADYIIYNSTIDGEIGSVEELVDKCGLLSDFKAVQEGRVYCTTRNLYQEMMSAGDLIQDIHIMLTSGEAEKMHYLYPVE